MTYALDTNAVSDWLNKNKQISEKLNYAIRQGNMIVLPPIVYYELRRGFKYKTAPGKEFAFSLICQSL